MPVTEAASAPGACRRSCPGSGTFPPTNSLIPTPSYHLPHTISLLPTPSYLIPTPSYHLPHTISLLPTPSCQLPQPRTNSPFLCPTSPPSFSSAFLLLQCPPTCLPTQPPVPVYLQHGYTCNTCFTATPSRLSSLAHFLHLFVCVCVCVCVGVSQDLSGSLVDDFIFDEVFVSLARARATSLSLSVCVCLCLSLGLCRCFCLLLYLSVSVFF
jgi:hypothetical protein